ncbi:MAG: cell division protein FtsZ [Parcubacteria group bacterium LiPW_41]|nr:MAG: cell division protein FtsZ [Parcubacteria group bacterium LiPW_41]
MKKKATKSKASKGVEEKIPKTQKTVKKSSVQPAKIKVIGVGGGGGNAISRMMESPDRVRGVEFIAVNTDAQDLDFVSAHRKVYIGKALTRGLGAGMNPEVGKQAAEENRSEIGELIDGADIVFVTAGFGGGTGTGAAPVVAEVAKEKGILTIGIVTKPFMFEGSQRTQIAQEGITRLKDKVDALVVIPNDRIFSLIDKETSMAKAFGFIDEVLKNGVQSLAELINTPGLINVDFADVRATLKDAGTTLIGIGLGSGTERASKAIQSALNSPLLEISIDGARSVLFSIAGGKDIKMAEVHEIASAVSSGLDANARVIFGSYYDRSLKDKSIKVTVIATGFNGVFSQRMIAPTLFMTEEIPKVSHHESQKQEEIKEKPKTSEEKQRTQESEGEEEWEIPAFLRKKKK